MVVVGLQFLQLRQLDDYWNCLRLSFDFLVFVQPLVSCCLVIVVLIGSDIAVMVGCVVLKYVQ